MRSTVERRVPRPRRALIGLTATAGVLIALSAWQTAVWTLVWRNNTTVFRQMILADSADYRGWWLFGMLERNNGRVNAALPLLDNAYRLFPRDQQLLVDYSETLLAARVPSKAASIAVGLMSWPKFRAQPQAVALYLDALRQAYGADSVIAAGKRLFAQAPVPTTALFVGAAQEARGERTAAAETYRAGLRAAPSDTALRSRLLRVEQASP